MLIICRETGVALQLAKTIRCAPPQKNKLDPPQINATENIQ